MFSPTAGKETCKGQSLVLCQSRITGENFMEDMMLEMYFEDCMELCSSIWRDGLASDLELESMHLRDTEHSDWQQGENLANKVWLEIRRILNVMVRMLVSLHEDPEL